MDCREIVRERAMAGRGALSAWRWKCGMSVGEVRVKLMEALVESALMYGAEVWGSCKWLDCIEQAHCCEPLGYSWGLAGYTPRHLYKLFGIASFEVKNLRRDLLDFGTRL